MAAALMELESFASAGDGCCNIAITLIDRSGKTLMSEYAVLANAGGCSRVHYRGDTTQAMAAALGCSLLRLGFLLGILMLAVWH